MIAFDGLRVDGQLIIDHGWVTRADPIVLLSLRLVLDLAGRGELVTGDRGVVRIAGDVSYQPVGWWSGSLIFQRVEDGWTPRPEPRELPPAPGWRRT